MKKEYLVILESDWDNSIILTILQLKYYPDMIYPGFISRQPNVEIFLKRMRTKVEKDYKKPSILWGLPLAVLILSVVSLFGKNSETFTWTYKLSIVLIAALYVVIAFPLISKEKLLQDDSSGAVKSNLTNMKAYYQKAFDEKWRYIVLVVLCITLGVVTAILADPGIEQFRLSTADAIFESISSFMQNSFYLVLVIGSYSSRKRNSALIMDLEKKYNEMGVNL